MVKLTWSTRCPIRMLWAFVRLIRKLQLIKLISCVRSQVIRFTLLMVLLSKIIERYLCIMIISCFVVRLSEIQIIFMELSLTQDMTPELWETHAVLEQSFQELRSKPTLVSFWSSYSSYCCVWLQQFMVPYGEKSIWKVHTVIWTWEETLITPLISIGT